MQACEFCGGLGMVESAVAERYRRGDAIRKLRVKKWLLTQGQMAQILRMIPILLNDIEHGRAEWPAWMNRNCSRSMATRECPCPTLASRCR
jgi:hypothetical protein